MFKWITNSGSASKQNTIIPVPRKRQKRAKFASAILCATTALLIIVFCVVNAIVIEYYPDANQKNSTNICYREKKKLNYPGLFTAAISLFGAVLGTLVDRLSLIFQECFHIQQRYNGSRKKMIKACFSGISWRPVIVLLIVSHTVLAVSVIQTGKPWFELSYILYIFGGIAIVSLMRLLGHTTQSEVDISTIIEEKRASVADGLAWSYYFNYLTEALLKFNEMVSPGGCITVALKQQGVELNSNKLILLITQDCKTTDDLEELDNNIKKLKTFSNGKYTFPVYELKYNGLKQRYVIEYVRQPLETLARMSRYGRIKILDEKQREYQVKLLYKTLYEILKETLATKCQDKCILIGIHANSRQCLNNGNLVSIIKQYVEANESARDHEDGPIRLFKSTNEQHATTRSFNSAHKSTSSTSDQQLTFIF